MKYLFIVFSICIILLSGCADDAEARRKSTRTPRSKPTATATINTPTPTNTLIPTNTGVPIVTPTPTPTNTPVPTATDISIPTPTNTAIINSLTLPLRAVFYYPWFPEAWNQSGINPFTNYHPTDGFYDSSDTAEIQRHISAMQYANIDVAISSWWGQGTQTDIRVNTLLGQGFNWSLYYEAESLGDPSSAQITNDLIYIQNNYASNPNFLHINGRFVIFVFADGADGCGMADRWKAGNAVNAYIVLKVFSGYLLCSNQPDGWHQYGPAVAADVQGDFSYTISPGFWKAGEATPRLSRDLVRWNQNIRDMISSPSQWKLITTFNEWGEGTSIESAIEWGNAYLDALHNNGIISTTPTNTPVPTPVRTTVPTNTPTKTFIPTATNTRTPTNTPLPATATPTSSNGICGLVATPPSTYQHIIWIWMENHRFNDIFGNSSAPYENSLAQKCGQATNYQIVGSPSLPNYIGATSGSTWGITDDNSPSSHVLIADNLFRQVRAIGGTEKSYQESMPSNCLTGNSGIYAVKHNPAAYYQTVADRTACNANDIPMGSISSGNFLNDLNNNALPTFSFITPNLCNDTHDCSVNIGDLWLMGWVPLILNSIAYQSGNTAIIIMWDEYTPIPNIFIAPSIIPGIKSAVAFNHYSLLRTTEEMLGITTYLGSANSSLSMRSTFGF